MAHHHHGAALAPQTEGRLIRWANRYDLSVQLITMGHAGRLRRLIARQVGAHPGERVLDVGCGTGDLALVLARQVGSTGKVAAIDPSPEMVATSARYMGPEAGQDWVEQAARLSPQLIRIAVRPTWVDVLDFQTRLPGGMERRLRQVTA